MDPAFHPDVVVPLSKPRPQKMLQHITRHADRLRPAILVGQHRWEHLTWAPCPALEAFCVLPAYDTANNMSPVSPSQLTLSNTMG